jgi:transposase
MSISAIANYFGVDWKTVKNVDKEHLRRKYRNIPLADVNTIGVDEIYVGRKRYKTVVRDLQTGAVLHVADGRGADALKPFGRRLHSADARVKAIAMDMAAGYAAWAQEDIPDAVIVYDHFHLIKLMNDKLDHVRRRTVNELDEQQTALLKKNASYC